MIVGITFSLVISLCLFSSWQLSSCQDINFFVQSLPCWCVLVGALPRRSAKRLSSHQSSWASAGVYGTFPSWRARRNGPVGSNLESLGPVIFFNKPRSVRSPCELGRRLDGRWSLDRMRGYQWSSLRASAVRVLFQVCILISGPKNGFFRTTHILMGKTHKCSRVVINIFQGSAAT